MNLSEDVIEQRTIEAKAMLSQLQSVFAHWLEGLTVEQSAERLCVSPRTVEYRRRYLRLVRAQGGRGDVKPMGRSREALS